ncbi:MAG TPA: AraC family transcriptional regulator [Stenotrophobium sp.]|jgi:AraC-like DNA-binding protein|nr:AraC family transcriptional regulator [Stenotrophobium sp.]
MQAYWNFKRNISSTRILAEIGAEHGVGIRKLLHGTTIDARRLHDHNGTVGAEEELRVIRNLLEAAGDDKPLALKAGLRYHPTTFGVLGFAILSSATVRSAIGLGLRYLRLTSFFCRMQIVEAGDETLIDADDHELPADLCRFLVERDGATLLNLSRDMMPPDFAFARLEIRHSRPPYASYAEQIFGRRIDFLRPQNRVGIDRAIMDWKLPLADPPMRRRFETECQRLLREYDADEGIANRVRAHLLQQPGRIPTMHNVARDLQSTVRTLRRRLLDDGIDFESLVDDIRQSTAEYLLKTTDLSIAAVAEHLGYSEGACFTRAFKRWKSVTPRQYRASLQPANPG